MDKLSVELRSKAVRNKTSAAAWAVHAVVMVGKGSLVKAPSADRGESGAGESGKGSPASTLPTRSTAAWSWQTSQSCRGRGVCVREHVSWRGPRREEDARDTQLHRPLLHRRPG